LMREIIVKNNEEKQVKKQMDMEMERERKV
jgi:hypothetical protein